MCLVSFGVIQDFFHNLFWISHLTYEFSIHIHDTNGSSIEIVSGVAFNIISNARSNRCSNTHISYPWYALSIDMRCFFVYWLFLSASPVKFNISPIFEPYLNVPLVVILGATEVKKNRNILWNTFFPYFLYEIAIWVAIEW